MFATGIVVFREVLEAALIVSIVMASCRGIAGRGLWVLAGIGSGLAGAIAVAASASAIAEAVSGMGQEIFNAGVLFAAVLMLAWHNIWMASHGRQLAKEVGAVGHDIATGTKPLYAVAVVTGLAVLREGSETVLFVYGIMTSGGSSTLDMLIGGLGGLAAGAGVGVLLYFGLLRIPMSRLFTVTNWMVLFLAAGMAAQCAGFLEQADLLPSLGNALWDTSSILSETSLLGRVLHTLTGYVAQPSGLQLVFYVTTLAVIALLMETIGKSSADNGRVAPAAEGQS
jgi:high-affinity iron transporter